MNGRLKEFPESDNEKKTHFHFTRIEYSTTNTTTTTNCTASQKEIRDPV